MLKKAFAAVALALLASSSFAAAPTGFYAGADLGVTDIDGLDSSKTSLGAFAGYGFNQYVAVELGYRHLGKWDFGPVDVSAKQTHLSLVGSYPLSSALDVYGRLGYNDLRAEASYGGYTYGASTSTGLYGVGLSYALSHTLSARAELQKPSSDSTNFGIGLAWKF